MDPALVAVLVLVGSVFILTYLLVLAYDRRKKNKI